MDLFMGEMFSISRQKLEPEVENVLVEEFRISVGDWVVVILGIIITKGGQNNSIRELLGNHFIQVSQCFKKHGVCSFRVLLVDRHSDVMSYEISSNEDHILLAEFLCHARQQLLDQDCWAITAVAAHGSFLSSRDSTAEETVSFTV